MNSCLRRERVPESLRSKMNKQSVGDELKLRTTANTSASMPVLLRSVKKSSSVRPKPFWQKKPWQLCYNPASSQVFRGSGQPPIRIASGAHVNFNTNMPTRKLPSTQVNRSFVTKPAFFSRRVAGSTSQKFEPALRIAVRNELDSQRKGDGGVKKLTELWGKRSRGDGVAPVAAPKRVARTPLPVKVRGIKDNHSIAEHDQLASKLATVLQTPILSNARPYGTIRNVILENHVRMIRFVKGVQSAVSNDGTPSDVVDSTTQIDKLTPELESAERSPASSDRKPSNTGCSVTQTNTLAPDSVKEAQFLVSGNINPSKLEYSATQTDKLTPELANGAQNPVSSDGKPSNLVPCVTRTKTLAPSRVNDAQSPVSGDRRLFNFEYGATETSKRTPELANGAQFHALRDGIPSNAVCRVTQIDKVALDFTNRAEPCVPRDERASTVLVETQTSKQVPDVMNALSFQTSNDGHPLNCGYSSTQASVDSLRLPLLSTVERQTDTGDGKVQGQEETSGRQLSTTCEDYQIGDNTPEHRSICSEYSRAFDLGAVRETRNLLSQNVVTPGQPPATPLLENTQQEGVLRDDALVVPLTPTNINRHLNSHLTPRTHQVPRDLLTMDLRYHAQLFLRMHRKSSTALQIEQAAAEKRQHQHLTEVLDRGSSNKQLPTPVPTPEPAVRPARLRRSNIAAESKPAHYLKAQGGKKFITRGKYPDPYYIVAREAPGPFRDTHGYDESYKRRVHHVLDDGCTQGEVFDEIARLQIEDFLQRQNVAFITLGGVPGMGKSHTLFGGTTGIAFAAMYHIFTGNHGLNIDYEFRLCGCSHYTHRLYPLLPDSKEPSPVFTDPYIGCTLLKEMLGRRRGGGGVDMAMVCITMHDRSSGAELSRCTFVDTTSGLNTAKSNLIDCIKRNIQPHRQWSTQGLLEHGFYRKIKATVSGNDPGSTTLILCVPKRKMKDSLVAYLGTEKSTLHLRFRSTRTSLKAAPY